MGHFVLAVRLADLLGLQSPPVGDKVLRANEAIPSELRTAGRKMRIYQALILP